MSDRIWKIIGLSLFALAMAVVIGIMAAVAVDDIQRTEQRAAWQSRN